MPMNDTKALTVRLRPSLYEAAARLAGERAVSMNSLIQSSLESAIRADEEQAHYDAYTALGQDPECDVEYAIHAQAEVMLSEQV